MVSVVSGSVKVPRDQFNVDGVTGTVEIRGRRVSGRCGG